MIDLLLIDDEPSAIKSLEWEIENFCKNVKIVGTFTNAMLAAEFLRKNTVDCVFLDIEMPDMDGFQFLELFPNRNFSVVITTAFDQYAIKAIKESALDYLLKPIDSDDLIACFTKIEQQKSSVSISEKLEISLEKILQSTVLSQKKINITNDGKMIFLNPDDIIYCESDGNYCTIYLENKEKIVLSQKLKFMEEKLAQLQFFRIHNSYLINLNKVKEFHKTDEYVVLSNLVKIPVSRQKKSDFLDKL
ncbi:MAG: LytTR family DNA-binding domain-containing protein [Bacteroidales bacterium]|nr:LytTR family DNA-binding domain-containing protein [Bacteroidales bacterium]